MIRQLARTASAVALLGSAAFVAGTEPAAADTTGRCDTSELVMTDDVNGARCGFELTCPRVNNPLGCEGTDQATVTVLIGSAGATGSGGSCTPRPGGCTATAPIQMFRGQTRIIDCVGFTDLAAVRIELTCSGSISPVLA